MTPRKRQNRHNCQNTPELIVADRPTTTPHSLDVAVVAPGNPTTAQSATIQPTDTSPSTSNKQTVGTEVAPQKTAPNALSASALVELGAEVAKGTSRRKIMADHPEVPERLVRALQQAGLGVEEYRQKILSEFQDAALESVQSYREDLRQGKVSPNTKPLAAGILFDKAEGAGNMAKLQSIGVNIQINQYGTAGITKEQIIANLSRVAPTSPVLVETGDAAQPIEESPI